MKNELNEILWTLAVKAGAIAREEQDRARAELKPDQSYVTNVDLRLSELSVETLRDVIPEQNIVTEEHLDHLQSINASPPNEDELVAFVDPIDGTRNYFHNMPLYGFSVGILKNRRPWLGIVLYPALAEAVTCDGERVWFTRDAFSESPGRVELRSTDAELNYNSIVLCSEMLTQNYAWDHRKYHLMQTSCATINLCWPMMGRGAGCVFGAHPWDLAGSWAALSATGFVLKGFESGKEIVRYDPRDWGPAEHRISEPLIVCRPGHYDEIRAAVLPVRN